MLASADIMSAIDKFMAQPKVIVGADRHYEWGSGYNPHERVTTFPLQVSGEQLGAKLVVVGFPMAKILKFRLSICFNAAICRLDYTDETHFNTANFQADGVPFSVIGPHFHSWPLNRRFFRGVSVAQDLLNAVPFTIQARTFDSILRWFCGETRIEGLSSNHLIELPKADKLL